ncbi:DinB family protein [Robertmurraya massiliosenegalensis]|uniref:DinB family protein n=1 Tax=Robertmurraya massiliosenegalensis TaxID=1287657 RepID=UPI000314F87B|nr:DinB family protein [Robertmurraya massiliosenegalensis]
MAISEGKWSIREIVGHLYYWDKFILENMVPFMTDGSNLPPFPDHDQYNAEAISYLKDDSATSIIEHFVETRIQLTESLSNLDSDIRFTIGGGKEQFYAESFTEMFLEHDEHHLNQINEKLHI